ncbi:MAG: 16S rRNA (guanine(966)-N(2))-methyltransferase RsmD [Bacteroidota bacterium]
MRIIGGKFGGRVIQPFKNLPARPTTDRTKEALFNILEHQIDWEETHVLDLFSGTGNISLECWSRGAKLVHSVERDRKCIASIRQAFKQLDLPTDYIFQNDVLKYVKHSPFTYDLIFMDPPYAMDGQEALIENILQKPMLKEEGMLVVEHMSQRDFSALHGFQRVRKYGSSSISFFLV